ncbi:MAG TPA: L-rhamnose mutarotase [Chitinophagaceae bacterium]
MKRYSLALDLKDDEELIRQYEEHHQAVWPEIKESLASAGILEMEIYRIGTRLFMIMETTDEFSFEAKGRADKENGKVIEWEELMSTYQQVLPQAKPGEKWLLMKNIFQWKKN